MELYFRPEEVPRSIKRPEWYRIWRWTRIQRKELAESMERKRKMLLAVPPSIRQDIINEMIYPPLLLGPYMDKSK